MRTSEKLNEKGLNRKRGSAFSDNLNINVKVKHIVAKKGGDQHELNKNLADDILLKTPRVPPALTMIEEDKAV